MATEIDLQTSLASPPFHLAHGSWQSMLVTQPGIKRLTVRWNAGLVLSIAREEGVTMDMLRQALYVALVAYCYPSTFSPPVGPVRPEYWEGIPLVRCDCPGALFTSPPLAEHQTQRRCFHMFKHAPLTSSRAGCDSTCVVSIE